MQGSLRCFLAVGLAAGARDAVSAWVNSIREAEDGVKWVDPANLHLTLKFLGATDPEAIPRLESEISEAVRPLAPFSITLGGTGAFPSPSRPRVFWIGISTNGSRLASLYQAVEDAALKAGFAPEHRSFNPHLSVGRVREGATVSRRLISGVTSAAAREFGVSGVEGVTLYRSDLRPGGPVYAPLGFFPLMG
ncbi:MAG: RNA 2',3'-cyclic phosphodiesterase [Firmicutes bacterium]|nr:RNA 2',3'-cyclic phosphodiesterase [Bacillota bacterium]